MTSAAETVPEADVEAYVAPNSPEALEAVVGLENGFTRGTEFAHDFTHEQILRHAARGGFRVTRQFRQDKLRRKAGMMKRRGLLRGGREDRYRDGHFYRITKLGLAVLSILEQRTRDEAQA